MINVAEIVMDPDFAEPLTIIRSTFTFGLVDSNTETQIQTYGIATPAKPQELMQVPEGDRVSGAMTFRSTTPFFLSTESTQSSNADVILWRGVRWKVIYVFPWDHFGCPKAIATLEPGNQGVLLP